MDQMILHYLVTTNIDHYTAGAVAHYILKNVNSCQLCNNSNYVIINLCELMLCTLR